MDSCLDSSAKIIACRGVKNKGVFYKQKIYAALTTKIYAALTTPLLRRGQKNGKL